MGFQIGRIDGAISAKGEDLEACLQHLIDLPPDDAGDSGAGPVETELVAMGFDRGRIKQAIRAKGEVLEAALQWLVEDGDRVEEVAPPPAKVQKREPPQARPPPPAPAAAPAPPARKAAAAPPLPPPRPAAASASSSSTASRGGPIVSADGSHRSLKRLMKEYNELNALEAQPGGCRKLHAFEASPVDDSDLYTWDLRLYDFESDQPITTDLKERGLDRLTLRIIFPQDYPNSPPFVYMLRPRLRQGTGYVLNGGGICMELLTPSEWSPATSISALVMSVRAMLLMGNVRLKETARSTTEHDYSLEEVRVCGERKHPPPSPPPSPLPCPIRTPPRIPLPLASTRHHRPPSPDPSALNSNRHARTLPTLSSTTRPMDGPAIPCSRTPERSRRVSATIVESHRCRWRRRRTPPALRGQS